MTLRLPVMTIVATLLAAPAATWAPDQRAAMIRIMFPLTAHATLLLGLAIDRHREQDDACCHDSAGD